ncbi:hypothetical protein BDN67DRAFT_1016008 [Paxillus ammoniavirescens]|nr:hypothetical protein BDN67DRAFT_1016008 [Paxillus ammoniavirescens]
MHGRSTTIFWVEDVVGNEPRHLWEQYGAFQRSRKNSDPHQSNRLQQVHPYARGIKHAQHFSVALTVTRNELALLRGESSDTERLELALPDGRGCIKLIQILLGIALAEGGNLGQNSDVDLATSPPTTAPSVQVSYRESKFTASSSQTHSAPASLSTHDISQPVLSSSGKAPHTSDASVLLSAAASSNSKSDDGDDPFIVTTASGYCSPPALFAEWARHYPARIWSGAEQDEVLETLGNRNLHDHLVVPFKSFKASRKNETCKTLGAIRAFLDDQLAGLPVEHHVLKVSLSELKRPVKYFWGVHDFVRGVTNI